MTATPKRVCIPYDEMGRNSQTSMISRYPYHHDATMTIIYSVDREDHTLPAHRLVEIDGTSSWYWIEHERYPSKKHPSYIGYHPFGSKAQAILNEACN